jgi:small subunit ribosomal protein S17
MADKKAKDAAAEADVPEDIKEPQAAEETASPDDAAPAADAPADEPVAEATEPEEPAAVDVVEEPVAADADEEPVAADADEEPVAADVVEEPVAEAGGETAAAAAPAAAEPKRKKKRLPRALRPARTRKTREPSATRKPIVRLETPLHERGRRQERQGTVVSDAMEKTIVVRVDVVKAHPRYKKVVRRSVKFHAHDESSQAKVGDVVRIVETRPLSKTKRWRLAEVVEAAK